MSSAAGALADELAPQGSEDYYIARLHPASERAAVALHLALEDRLLGALRDARSPEAARLKLLWWRECFLAATEGEHRHPLVHALAGRLPAGASAWPLAFLGAAEALGERLDRQAPQPAGQWLGNLRACEGALAVSLASSLRGAPPAAELAPLADLAAGTQWARGLQWLPHWQRLGIHWLPREDLQPHAGDRAAAGGGVHGDAAPHPDRHWPRLAAAFAGRSLGGAREARGRLGARARRVALAQRIRLALAHLELRHSAQAGWPVLSERVTLTPLTRLLAALAVAWFDHLPRGPEGQAPAHTRPA